MSTFKEFIDSKNTLPTIQSSTIVAVRESFPKWVSIPSDEKEKFSEKVSNIAQDQAFLSEFSDKIGKPLENESEEEFVKRSSNILREMLYAKFGISA